MRKGKKISLEEMGRIIGGKRATGRVREKSRPAGVRFLFWAEPIGPASLTKEDHSEKREEVKKGQGKKPCEKQKEKERLQRLGTAKARIPCWRHGGKRT